MCTIGPPTKYTAEKATASCAPSSPSRLAAATPSSPTRGTASTSSVCQPYQRRLGAAARSPPEAPSENPGAAADSDRAAPCPAEASIGCCAGARWPGCRGSCPMSSAVAALAKTSAAPKRHHEAHRDPIRRENNTEEAPPGLGDA